MTPLAMSQIEKASVNQKGSSSYESLCMVLKSETRNCQSSQAPQTMNVDI
jgi:hypothetical protein